MPILCAMSITLSWPTLVDSRTNAQFTESAVAIPERHRRRRLPRRSSVTRPCRKVARVREHGDVAVDDVVRASSRSRAQPASVITFHVEPGWRPIGMGGDVVLAVAEVGPTDHRLHAARGRIDRHERRDPVGPRSAACALSVASSRQRPAGAGRRSARSSARPRSSVSRRSSVCRPSWVSLSSWSRTSATRKLHGFSSAGGANVGSGSLLAASASACVM